MRINTAADKTTQKIEQLEIELRILGFACAKDIALILGRTSGVMECPLCHGQLRFSIAAGSGHMRAQCQTEHCLNMME